MDGQDLIAVAAHLTQNAALGKAEARYRSVISRAYYGAFHLVAQFLAEHNRPVRENHTGHQAAYVALFETGITEAVQAARILSDLRSQRNTADYRLSAKGFDDQAHAMQQVESAEAVRALLDRCRQNPDVATKLEGR
jgi:uncharacterized protein (UPF0332 family)